MRARPVLSALFSIAVACGSGDGSSAGDVDGAEDAPVVFDLSDAADTPQDRDDGGDPADDLPNDIRPDSIEDAADEDAVAVDVPVDETEADLAPDTDVVEDVEPVDSADEEDVDAEIEQGDIGVTVLDRSGAPLWGAAVIQHREDGSTFQYDIVDAETHPGGRVVVNILTGDGITVAHERDDGFALYSIIDLRPGDELTVRDPRLPVNAVLRDATQFVEIPSPEIDAEPFTAATFVVTNGCRSLQLSEFPSEPVRLDFPSGCVGSDGSLDIVAWGLDDLHVPLAFTVLLESPFPSAEPAQLPGWSDATDLSALTVTLGDSPTDVRPSLRLTVSKAGQTYSAWPSTRPTDPSTVIAEGEGQSFVWGVVPAFGDSYEHTVTIGFGTVEQPLDGQVVYRRRDSELLSTVAIDLSDDSMSRVEHATIMDTTDPARPYFQWVLSDEAPAADMVEMRVRWTQNGPAPADREWTIVAPADVPTSFRLPSLVDDLAQFRPDNQILSGRVEITYWEADFVNNYRGLVNLLGLGQMEQTLRDLAQFTIVESRVTNE